MFSECRCVFRVVLGIRIVNPVKDASRVRLLNTAAAGCVAVPFVFALIRAIETGRDFRYFWVALAAVCGAAAIAIILRPSSLTVSADIRRAASMFALATLFALLAGLLFGTRFGPGVVAVAVAFGACVAFGGFLHLLARR
jgi:hypothetical protein